MPKTASNNSELPDPTDSEPRNLRLSKLVLEGSILVYLGLAFAVVRWLPDFMSLAYALLFFAISSAAYLVAGEGR